MSSGNVKEKYTAAVEGIDLLLQKYGYLNSSVNVLNLIALVSVFGLNNSL